MNLSEDVDGNDCLLMRMSGESRKQSVVCAFERGRQETDAEKHDHMFSVGGVTYENKIRDRRSLRTVNTQSKLWALNVTEHKNSGFRVTFERNSSEKCPRR